jgi:hypothetical protein
MNCIWFLKKKVHYDVVWLTGIKEGFQSEDRSDDGALSPQSSEPLGTDIVDTPCSGRCLARPESHHISATPVFGLT